MSEIKQLAHSLDNKIRTKDVILEENISFESLLLPQTVLKGLSDSGFQKPSPIQIKALPFGRCGFDLTLKSKSGTGKTLVFGIIALETVRLEKIQPQVLILAPTREIAVQIQDVIKSIGKYLEGLQVECFIGGLSLESDKLKCKSCHIAIGTPGRLKQLIQGGNLNTNFIRLFVLDEADKLMETSFQNDINEIYNSLCDKKQVIMCSATYPNELESFLNNYMLSPTFVSAELETPLLLGLKQFVSVIKSPPNVVQQTKLKNQQLLTILSSVSFTQCLIFSNYQTRAESISNFLNRSGWNSTFISAAQNQTERLSSLLSLKEFKCRIMISTDLTSRGIDAANVDLVINYDIPQDAMTYLHRMGRAGRYGSTGVCINLALKGQEVTLLQNILGIIGGQNLSIPILENFLHVNKDSYTEGKLLFGIVPENFAELNNKCKSEVFEIKNIRGRKEKKGHKNSKKQGTKVDITNDSEIINKVVQEKLSDVDISTVLGQLASGTFELDQNLEPVNFNSCINDVYNELLPSPPKNVSVKSTKDKDNHDCANFEALDSKSVLQHLALEGTLPPKDFDDKKRKRSESSANSPTPEGLKTEEFTKNRIFCKNKALFSAAKSLSNFETSQDDTDSLSQYLSLLRAMESSEAITVLKNSEESMEGKVGIKGVLENIFSLAYKSAIDLDSISWQEYLSEDEKKKLNKNYAKDEDSDDKYEDYYDEEEYDEEGDDDYNFEIEKDIKLNYEQSTEHDASQDLDDYSFMKWIPVNSSVGAKTLENMCTKASDQSSSSNSKLQISTQIGDNIVASTSNENNNHHYYEHFSPYYQHCSEHLWQTGLSFENVRRFDEWFCYEWQSQIFAIRDYMQQRIYVEEMKGFKIKVGNRKGSVKK